MNNNFSKNLKKIRKENNLSQEQLAEELGVSRQAISKWESKQAYPEMDKIIQISKMFKINIDSLLNDDASEIKKEQASKNLINKYMDDFLNFISNSIKLICSMNFKSKIKFLFEQFMVAITLYVLFYGFGMLLSNILNPFRSIFQSNLYYFIFSILKFIYLIISFIIAIVIMIYIFKIRYVDYYKEYKDDENKIEDSKKEIEGISDNVNEYVKHINKNNRIVIRDPKHSEYGFIKGLLKIVNILLKFILLGIILFLSFTLLLLSFIFIISFQLIKTGLFFTGLIAISLSLSIINIIMLLMLINYVFNRKTNKKILINSFIGSVIACGIGFGILFIGLINFDYIKSENDYYTKTNEFTISMNDKLYFLEYGYDIKYIQTNDNDIKIKYKSSKYCTLKYKISSENYIYFNENCQNNFEIIKDYLKNINNNKIYIQDDTNRTIEVYSNEENLDTLKKNKEDFLSKQKEIDNLNYKNDLLESKIEEYKSENEELKDELSAYKQKGE